jgi:4-nitrophenyl phosphatase
MNGMRTRDARLIIFDLDGVIYRGGEAIRGAPALVNAVRAAGRSVSFATNNSMATRADYVERLATHGITSSLDEIVTSSSATVDHLHNHLPDVRSVLAVGGDGLLAELRTGGYRATAAGDGAPEAWNGEPLAERYDAVVAGLDQAIDYRRLGIAGVAIRSGARFIATNADVRYPTPTGFVPGAGTIVAALQATSGVEPVVIGKPQPAMFQAILERSGVPPGQALVVGDNPDADIVAARRAGIVSILVLTGVADRAMASSLEGERRPDHVADGPEAVASLLGVSLS